MHSEMSENREYACMVCNSRNVTYIDISGIPDMERTLESFPGLFVTGPTGFLRSELFLCANCKINLETTSIEPGSSQPIFTRSLSVRETEDSNRFLSSGGTRTEPQTSANEYTALCKKTRKIKITGGHKYKTNNQGWGKKKFQHKHSHRIHVSCVRNTDTPQHPSATNAVSMEEQAPNDPSTTF